MGTVCRHWSKLALCGAVAAFCEVFRAHLLPLPVTSEIVFVDAVLFVLPSVALARACGASEAQSASVLHVATVSILSGSMFDGEVRSKLAILGVAFVQGASACIGLSQELQEVDPSLERRAATCIAIIGLLGLGFTDIWDDVAWTGVAAYAFACLAYLVHEQPEQNQTVALALDDDGLPLSERVPRAKPIEQAERRPDRRDDDPSA